MYRYASPEEIQLQSVIICCEIQEVSQSQIKTMKSKIMENELREYRA